MKGEVEERLVRETEQWRERLSEELRNGLTGNPELIENIEAYIADSEHFEDEGLLVESFEAVIWAWSWLEIGRRLDEIESDS